MSGCLGRRLRDISSFIDGRLDDGGLSAGGLPGLLVSLLLVPAEHAGELRGGGASAGDKDHTGGLFQ